MPEFSRTLSVVMPAFNEEENLGGNIPLLVGMLEELVRGFEIIIVDDGSTDSTARVVEALNEKDPRIKLVRHETNRGPGSGLVTGMPLAENEYVIFLPADLGMKIGELRKYVEAAENADVVVGVSTIRTDYSLARKLSSKVYIALIKILFRLPYRQFNFVHLYRKEVVDACRPEVPGVFVSVELLLKARRAGFRSVEVDIDYEPRRHGAASCGKPAVITRTIGDALKFWWDWNFGRQRR